MVPILSGQSVPSLFLAKSEIVNLPWGLLVVVWAFIYTEGLALWNSRVLVRGESVIRFPTLDSCWAWFSVTIL